MSRPIPAIAAGEVHVWHTRPTALGARHRRLLTAFLAADERARAVRFADGAARQQYEVGRGLLRTLLGAYLACSPGHVRLQYGPFGKPQLAGGSFGCDLQFSVSHSGEVLVLAFARDVRVGIDVERIVDVADGDGLLDVARQTCTPCEVRALVDVAAPERRQKFFATWTRREAFVKATGDGIRMLTSDLDVPSGDGEWLVLPIDVGAGYTGSLAVHAGRINLRHLTWTEEHYDPGFREYAPSDCADCQ